MVMEVSWDGLWTLSFGLSQYHGHGSWLVCELALGPAFMVDLAYWRPVWDHVKGLNLCHVMHTLGLVHMGSQVVNFNSLKINPCNLNG